MGGVKVLFLLFAGVLSVFYAEVLAGSSILWFADVFGYIFLLPLYMFHLILLFNLAQRFNRLTSTSLYLFGVIFGLYETWMTKVDWAGFVNGSPILGTPLGFAVAEMSIVTFFWHPFMSFIAPLVSIKILSDHIGNEDSVSDLWASRFLSKSRLNVFFYYLIVFFAAFSVALNSGFDIVVSLAGILITLGMIFLLYKIILVYDRSVLSLDSLIVSNKALVAMGGYLLFIYWLFFVNIRTEAIPGTLTIVLTVAIYVFIALLIYLDKTRHCFHESVNDREKMSRKDLFRFYLIILVLNVIADMTGMLLYPITVVLFLILIITGSIILAYSAFKALKGC